MILKLKKYSLVLLFVGLISAGLFTSCEKDAIDSGFELMFSTDTLSLDTLITNLGSKTTYELKVYNSNKNPVIISSIELANGNSSDYIFNVNGIKTGAIQNIEIKANDSIYIFVQAKLKRNNVDTLVYHEDKLLFKTKDKIQAIPIVSWGRDAQFIKNQTIQTTTWNAGKSYLIFDSLVIEKNQTLTIEEGVMVLFKPNANLIVKGKLIVKGSIEKPVMFKGYRFESYYQKVPGQWGSIIFDSTSTNNKIENSIIANGTTGMRVQSSKVNLSLKNVKVEYMSYAALMAQGSTIEAVNCIFANSDKYALLLSQGGNYSFTHITVSNYDNSSIRSTASVSISNYKTVASSELPADITKALFQNSIIVGSLEDEIKFDKKNSALFNVQFDNCLVKQSKSSEYFNAATKNIKSTDKFSLFTVKGDEYMLDSASIARDIGNITIATSFPLDIKGRSRIVDGKPDLGAYEYFKDTSNVKK